jgi:aryl-alcohol dehydrogenase-like predicted oxidoreductase
MLDRIGLGTAQFGLVYGLANTRGQITREEGAAILSIAREAGIRTLDTAVLYGESEAALGALGVSDWQVITKLPEVPAGVTSVAAWVQSEVAGSLARLRIPRLHGLLLHRPAQLLGPHGRSLYDALLAERAQGRTYQIGVSVYGPDELDSLPTSMTFDIVQAPWNVLDQRMVSSGWAQRLQEMGCEFHARSVFLQGLLLMARGARPPRFARWNTVFDTWERWLAQTGLCALAACLQSALATPGVNRVIVGVDSAAHISQIIAAAQAARPTHALPRGLSSEDPALVNPALWSST